MYFVIHLIFPINVWPRLICSDGLNGRDVLEENAENNSFDFQIFYLENNIEDVAEQETDENHQKQHIDIFGLEPVKVRFLLKFNSNILCSHFMYLTM